MKIILIIVFFAVAPAFITNTTAQSTPPQTTSDTTLYTKTYVDSIKKILNDSLKKVTKESKVGFAPAKFYGPQEIAELIIIIAFFLIMILLIYKFFRHLADHKQRIGYQSIKLIGLILIFPGICILALVGGEKILSGQTLAVLLGTIAGYVLSREDESKQEINDAKIKAYEETIKSLKEGKPSPVP